MSIPTAMSPLGGGRFFLRRLSYLQSHGNGSGVGEYIDTGWYFKPESTSFRIEARLNFMPENNHTASWPVACGANNSNGGATKQYYKIQGNPRAITQIVYGNADEAQSLSEITVPASSVPPYQPFTVDMNYSNGTTTVLTNGSNQLSWTRPIDERGTTTCHIFSLNTGNGPTFAVDMRLYYFRIYEDGILVRDFIPVLDLKGVPCLFDRVGKHCYYNQADGAIGFMYGEYIDIPTDGLVFYAPLGYTATTAETGQTLVNVNTIFTELSGVRCARVGATSPNSYIYTESNALPKGNEPRTISTWVNTNTGGPAMGYGYGNSAFGQAWMQGIECFSQYEASIQYQGSVPDALNHWHNVVTTYDGTTVKCYVDAALMGQKDFSLNTIVGTNYPLYLGSTERLRDTTGTHYLAHVRVYNRELTQKEIDALSMELN